MIEAVAHQMGQGIDDAFNQAFIQFSRATLHLQPDLFTEFGGQIALQLPHTVEQFAVAAGSSSLDRCANMD
ncbi:hypothetical protein SGGMMB4_04935 [Sodalis glossinidius str. 'morsitans']|uniref:Uncharacterized protein n=1 Tax=Sodalis glossinidius (strain morsitans) TaxID=343509 RepID=A0A193QMH2_SODGM|nr:hypothetical protein SGGMMB4_04935 [Sodalis glossinidius str. 'morsitans']